MAAVKQQVLNWLYSVLTSEYAHVNRTYNDVAQTLSHYSSLSPRTDVYTYENGASALLLHLTGTLPVTFRGTIYRFPISLWLPHKYPREAPLVYVTPTDGMVVRHGQHVDLQGKVYHPYLVGWAEFWDKSNILDFLAILRDVFAKEPPVISRRQQQNAPPRPQQAAIPPPIPLLPPGVGRPISISSNSLNQPQPPLPPPKPTSNQPHSASPQSRRDSGPALPPLPPQASQRSSQYGPPPPQSPPVQQYAPQRSSSLRYEMAPPLPPQPQRQQALREESYTPSPVSPITPPEDPYHRPSYTQSYQQPQFIPNQQFQGNQQQNRPPSYMQPPPNAGPPRQWQQYPPQQPQQPQKQPQYKPPPPPDLIDTPLTLPVPSDLPPPPVPVNPEVGLLLHNIGRALHSQRQHLASQTTSSLPGLQAQHTSMLTALTKMQSEIQALESLSSLLTSNSDILHNALRDADGVIDSSAHRTAPSIDEILIAPTVVGNQLYELVSEERSLGDALFVLGRAVEKGRISPQTFAKMTRSLAREWYLKKALVKKISKGIGLDVY